LHYSYSNTAHNPAEFPYKSYTGKPSEESDKIRR